jgi:hypothetical protein
LSQNAKDRMCVGRRFNRRAAGRRLPTQVAIEDGSGSGAHRVGTDRGPLVLLLYVRDLVEHLFERVDRRGLLRVERPARMEVRQQHGERVADAPELLGIALRSIPATLDSAPVIGGKEEESMSGTTARSTKGEIAARVSSPISCLRLPILCCVKTM